MTWRNHRRGSYRAHRRQQAIPVLECGIVLVLVVVAEIAPVTVEVALEIGHGIEDAALNQLAHARGHNDLAGLDAWLI